MLRNRFLAILLIAVCVGAVPASAQSRARSVVDGLYVIPSEVQGYQDERLELKNGHFRYWFSSDAVIVDEHGRELGPKYPLRGAFQVKGKRIVFSDSSVEDRYTDVVNGVAVLWRLQSKRIWEREHKIYDYGVLIRVAAKGADAESPSVRVLYDAEMRKKHDQWLRKHHRQFRDPFVDGPQ